MKDKPVRHTKPCQMPGCEKWAWAQGFCDPHYQKLKRTGEIDTVRIFNDDLERFHTKYQVNEETGCWEWTAFVHPKGYGAMHITVDGKQKYVRAHRFSYERLVGPIPDGMKILHRCDNRKCVSPSHMRLGTDGDNMQDCVAKGRHSSQRGTNRRKLSPPMVLNIRVMYARGQHSLLDIARIYGVEEETIRGIVKGRAHQKAG